MIAYPFTLLCFWPSCSKRRLFLSSSYHHLLTHQETITICSSKFPILTRDFFISSNQIKDWNRQKIRSFVDGADGTLEIALKDPALISNGLGIPVANSLKLPIDPVSVVFWYKSLLIAYSHERTDGKWPNKGKRIDKFFLCQYNRVISSFCIYTICLCYVDVISICWHTVQLNYCFYWWKVLSIVAT